MLNLNNIFKIVILKTNIKEGQFQIIHLLFDNVIVIIWFRFKVHT